MVARSKRAMLLLLLVFGGAGPALAATAFENPRAEVPLTEIAGVPAPPARPVRPLGAQPEVETLYQQARELMGRGDYGQAVSRLERALNVADGDYYELPYLMAQAKFRLGNLGEARNFAELAALLGHGRVDVHYLLGRIYHRQGQLERAIAHLRTATLNAEREPDNPRATAAWLELGERLAEAGYWSAACASLAEFDRAIQSHAQHARDAELGELLSDRPVGALELRVDLLRRLGRSDEVLSVVEAAWRREPQSAYAMRLYAQALLEAGRAAEALAFCRSQLEMADRPGHHALLRSAVVAAQKTGQTAAWVEELAGRLAGEKEVEFAGAVARCLAEAKEVDAAVRLWEEIGRLRPQDPGPAWSGALVLRSAGRMEPALRALIEFTRANPDVAQIPHAALNAWLTAATPVDAVSGAVQQFKQMGESDFAACFVLATVAAGADEPETAEELFEAAMKARPSFALAQVAWGQMYVNRYEWEQAKAHARAALDIAPELAAAHFVLAAACDGLDENDEAEEAYRAAMRHQPGEADYVLALAEHHRRLGRSLAAQRYFQDALSLDPVNDRALEQLIESYADGGKLEIARSQLHKAEGYGVSDDALRRARTSLRFAGAAGSSEHVAELGRQFEAFPLDAQTGLRLSEGLYGLGRYEEAWRVLERIRGRLKEDERAISLTAALLNRRLEFDAAIGLLEKLSRRYPNRPRVLGQLAESYLIDFRLKEARELLTRLLALNPQEHAQQAYRRRLLACYVEPREYAGALELLDRWLATDPNQSEWIGEKLWVLSLAGRDEEAIELAARRLTPLAEEFGQRFARLKELSRRLREDPGNRDLQSELEAIQSELAPKQLELVRRREELVEACMRARSYDRLEPHLRQWLEDEPDDGLAMQWYVELLVADDRAEEAWELLEGFKAATLEASLAVEGWRVGVAGLIGRLDEVSQKLVSALEKQAGLMLPSHRAELWRQLIEAHRKARRYDEALGYCDRWFAELSAADQGAGRLVLRYKCSLLAEAGRQEEYVRLAEKLLEAEPGDPGLNNDLGYTWIDAGQNLERATRMIQRALAEDPLRAAYLDSLGWAYYKAGDFVNAQKFLRRAAQLREGQDAVVYDHWGDTEYRLGEPGVARRGWQQALELLKGEPDEESLVRPAELSVKLRSKLEALDRGEPVPVAPTAAEQAAAGQADAEQQ